MANVKQHNKDGKMLQVKREDDSNEIKTMGIRLDEIHMAGVAGSEASGAAARQPLNCQFQQHQTLVDTNTAQLEQLMEQMTIVEAQVKSMMGGCDEAENDTQPMVPNCEVNINGQRVVMGQTQVPHDDLKAMTLVHEWDVGDIKMVHGRANETRHSEVFPMKGFLYGAQTRLDIQGPFLVTYIQIIDEDINGLPIETKSIPKTAFVIKDLTNSTPNRDAIRLTYHRFNESLEDLIPWSSDGITGQRYLTSNRMKVLVYIEPPSIARSFFSNNGILLWRMDNYMKRKQMERDGLMGCQDSPYFYTSPQGYRVLLRLQLSWRYGAGLVLFLTGEHDSSLTKQFPHRFTMSVYNHRSQSFAQLFSKENSVACNILIDCPGARSSSLESNYVKDDSLIVKAVVEPLE